MISYFWVALGSALGGMARFWCSGFVATRVGDAFPWGTLAVNVIGSLLIGALAGLGRPDGQWFLSLPARQFLMIGVLGGYTTFSSFSLQTLNLARDGQWLQAGANVVLSVVACLFAVWLGYIAVAGLNQWRG